MTSHSTRLLDSGAVVGVAGGVACYHSNLCHCSVYDKYNHLCPFDTGLVEANVELYFSASVKAVYDENPDPAGETTPFM